MDRALGRLLDQFSRRGYDATNLLVVVTADHGEALGEHGLIGHLRGLPDTVLHVPLLIAGPGITPGEVTTPVQTVQLRATVRALLGLPRLPTIAPALPPWGEAPSLLISEHPEPRWYFDELCSMDVGFDPGPWAGNWVAVERDGVKPSSTSGAAAGRTGWRTIPRRTTPGRWPRARRSCRHTPRGISGGGPSPAPLRRTSATPSRALATCAEDPRLQGGLAAAQTLRPEKRREAPCRTSPRRSAEMRYGLRTDGDGWVARDGLPHLHIEQVVRASCHRGLRGPADADHTVDVRRAHAHGLAVLVRGGRAEQNGIRRAVDLGSGARHVRLHCVSCGSQRQHLRAHAVELDHVAYGQAGRLELAIEELQLEGLRGGAREPMGVRRPRERAPGARHGQPLERTVLRMGGLDRAAVAV